jgi:hypothetical protein
LTVPFTYRILISEARIRDQRGGFGNIVLPP